MRRFERGIIVDLLQTEPSAVREQMPRKLRIGDRIVAFVVDIEKNARGPRSYCRAPAYWKLFEQEVAEIYRRSLRLESSARGPVAQQDRRQLSRSRCRSGGRVRRYQGSRVQAVVQERGERSTSSPIAMIPARFVCNAIAPAEVSRVVIDAENHTMELIVPRRQAQPGDRQGSERAPGVAAYRLAHRYPRREPGQRAGGRRTPRLGRARRIVGRAVEYIVPSRLALSTDVAEARIEELKGVPGVGGRAGRSA